MKFKSISVLLSTLAVSFALQADECKNISKERVKETLKPILGNAQVISTSKSPVEGLHEIIVEVNGRKVPIYIDCSLNYLITGEIIDIKNKKSITRERVNQLKKAEVKEKSKALISILGKEKFEKIKKAFGEDGLTKVDIVNVSGVPSKGVVIYGNKDAKVKVYVITDPECPFCKRLHESMKEVLKDKKDVAFYLVMFPLPFHKNAQGLSEAVVCQKDNSKAKKLLDEIFESQSDKNKLKDIAKKHKCDEGKSIVDTHKAFAKSVKLGGTPTLVFDLGNGKGLKVSGAFPPEKLKQIVDALK